MEVETRNASSIDLSVPYRTEHQDTDGRGYLGVNPNNNRYPLRIPTITNSIFILQRGSDRGLLTGWSRY
jgi:hypothetical protein